MKQDHHNDVKGFYWIKLKVFRHSPVNLHFPRVPKSTIYANFLKYHLDWEPTAPQGSTSGYLSIAWSKLTLSSTDSSLIRYSRETQARERENHFEQYNEEHHRKGRGWNPFIPGRLILVLTPSTSRWRPRSVFAEKNENNCLN